jgi:hypothetical protein
VTWKEISSQHSGVECYWLLQADKRWTWYLRNTNTLDSIKNPRNLAWVVMAAGSECHDMFTFFACISAAKKWCELQEAIAAIATPYQLSCRAGWATAKANYERQMAAQSAKEATPQPVAPLPADDDDGIDFYDDTDGDDDDDDDDGDPCGCEDCRRNRGDIAF